MARSVAVRQAAAATHPATAGPSNLDSRLAGAAAVLSLIVVAVMAARSWNHAGSAPHFGMLAQAFLNGRLDLLAPVYDASVYGGRFYLPLGPMPAVLLIPFVVLRGPGAPILMVALPAAAATAIGLSLMWTRLGVGERWVRLALTVLTLMGTCYLSALVADGSYFASHVLVVALLTWAIALALGGRRPLLAGLLIAGATLTRAPAILAVVPVGLLYLLEGDPAGRPYRAALLAAGALPGLALTGLYDFLRFGSATESGYALQYLAPGTLRTARDVGVFSLAHLPKNLYYFLVAPPVPVGGEDAPTLSFPWIHPSDWGMGLVWISPWLLLGLAARGRRAAILGLGAGLLLLPSMLYYGIGWVQFGYRYGLDALPFMAGLVALAVQQRAWQRWLMPAVAYSWPVDVLGAAWLQHRLSG